jgi:PAS domain S-box-containing protein
VGTVRRALVDAEAALARTQALHHVSAALIAVDRLDSLLQRIVDVVAEALGAYRVHLFAIDDHRKVVLGDYLGGAGGRESATVDYAELMEGLGGWVLEHRQGMLSPGGARDPRESPRVDERRRLVGHGSMMVAPVLYGERALGVLVVTNRPDEAVLTEADLELLTAMASQCAVSIENTRIREELQAARDELEARVARRTAELAASEERYRRITETITDYVYSVTIGADGSMSTQHGPGCVAVTGYSAEEFSADPGLWMEMVVPEDRDKVLAQIGDVLSMGPAAPVEHLIVRKDGAVRMVRSTPVPHVSPDGRLIGYDGLISDVTERRALEEQLLQASKLQSIGRLAGGVAHDFNNLLTAILGNAELALADMAEDHPARTSVKEIVNAAQRAAAVTCQLLAFARKQMIEPVALDLSSEVAGSIEMLRRLVGEDVQVTADLEGALGVVLADQGQVQQLLVNLTVNARDAMREGGRLVISTASQLVGDEFRSVQPEVEPGWYAVLAVTDTGVGMGKEVQRHLFEPYFTTKRQGEGTGLGLAMCHGIAKQNGGHIFVHSELGLGTTVTVLLPVIEGMDVSKHDPGAPRPPALGSECILVVEDDQSVRRLAVLGLRGYGYTVLEAADAAEALEIVSGGTSMDMLVSDIRMPGMQGPELVRRILSLRPATSVLFISGHTDTPEKNMEWLGQPLPVLPKPFTPDRLARRVREVLDAR